MSPFVSERKVVVSNIPAIVNAGVCESREKMRKKLLKSEK
jgi:hypothetical protein